MPKKQIATHAQDFKVEMAPIDSITPYFNNPRRNLDAIPKVAALIQEVGWRQPIVVDASRVIVVGHTRWEAAKSLKHKLVPVHVAADLTPEQCRAYRIADNNNHGDWDDAKLMAEVLSISQEAKVDLALLGFDQAELDRLTQTEVPTRTLEDFEKLPVDGDRWIVVRASESQCARALQALKKLSLENAHIEYSGAGKSSKGG